MNTRVLESIECERDRQDKQWGGAEHDDLHSRDDWFEFIQWQIDKHKSLPGMQRIEQSRHALVKIAALAIAAIESIDRKEERNGIAEKKKDSRMIKVHVFIETDPKTGEKKMIQGEKTS